MWRFKWISAEGPGVRTQVSLSNVLSPLGGGTFHGTIPAHGSVLCTLWTAHHWAVGLKSGSKSVLKSHTVGWRGPREGSRAPGASTVHESYSQPSCLIFPNTRMLATYPWSTCFHLSPGKSRWDSVALPWKDVSSGWGKNSETQQQLNTEQYMFRCQMSRKDRGTFPDAPFGNTGNSWSSLWPQQAQRNTSVWGDTEFASSLLFPQPHSQGPFQLYPFPSPKLSPSLAYTLHKAR